MTTACKYDCSKDDIDFHGQWKNCPRQQDTYADTIIPFVDAKVLVAYIVKDASGITNQWILDYVVPSMRLGLFLPDPKNAPNVFAAAIPEQVYIILGRVLLFKIFDIFPGEK